MMWNPMALSLNPKPETLNPDWDDVDYASTVAPETDDELSDDEVSKSGGGDSSPATSHPVGALVAGGPCYAHKITTTSSTTSEIPGGKTEDFDDKCKEDQKPKGVFYIDFAGSDSLLKDAEYASYPDLQMFPSVRCS